MKTKLANLLVKHGIVQSAAIEDPEGYDKGATLEGIAKVAEELNKLTPEETELAEASAENEWLKRYLSVTEKQRDWWEQEARHYQAKTSCLTPEVQMAQDKLREVNSELAAEKTRLDWVSGYQEIQIYRAEFSGSMQWWLHRITPHDILFNSLREAIDAAMKEESKLKGRK